MRGETQREERELMEGGSGSRAHAGSRAQGEPERGTGCGDQGVGTRERGLREDHRNLNYLGRPKC